MKKTDPNLGWARGDGQGAGGTSSDVPEVRSLQTKDINVVFQPIVNLVTGKTYAAEALVRCRIPELASPLTLLAKASEEGYCGELGRIIRQVAFAHGTGIPLFVNIHPDELNSRFLVMPDDPLCFHDAAICLEITESATLEHYDLCVSVLKEVCSRNGAMLAIDDLGAGYSNLKRIIDLRPDVVKFDRSLVQGLDRNRRQQILVSHLVKLCVALESKVVLEGIETKDELLAAIDTGAHFAQGYLLARPGFPVPRVNWPL